MYINLVEPDENYDHRFPSRRENFVCLRCKKVLSVKTYYDAYENYYLPKLQDAALYPKLVDPKTAVDF